MQLGQILDKRYKKTKNPTTTSEEPGAEVACCTCTLYPTEGQPTHAPLQPDP